MKTSVDNRGRTGHAGTKRLKMSRFEARGRPVAQPIPGTAKAASRLARLEDECTVMSLNRCL